MKKYKKNIILLTVVPALMALFFVATKQPVSSAQTTGCNTTTHSAWFGAEENSLRNASRTVTWTAPVQLTVTNVALSASMAPFGSGFNEALYLVGVAAPGQDPWNGISSPDSFFSTPNGYTSDFHGNQPQSSVLDSAILKSTNGLAANESVPTPTNVVVPAGQSLFLSLASAGPAPSDMEAQVEITYQVCQ